VAGEGRERRLRALGIDRWVLQQSVPGTPAALDLAEPDTVEATEAPQVASVAAPVDAATTIPANIDLLDWDRLTAQVSNCRQCVLCETRHQTVLGTGARDAPLMIVGEGPGAGEDAQGLPFVGRAGKLLDEMLAAIDYSRDRNVYIANVVKCRPPGNRDPARDEAEACRPYLEAQIALVKPKLIVALGRIAAQRLLDTDAPLARLRGPLHQYGATATPLMVTYHPAYLLRSPREKAKSWQDLKAVWQQLHG
jgi:uracil-DNA glycosylase